MRTLAVILLFQSLSAFAGGTFIGNGGGAGDIELSVAKKQIEQSFEVIKGASGDLCHCNRKYETRPICQPILSLSTAQRDFCTATLKSQAAQVLSLLQNSQARFTWTNEPISIVEDGRTRAVDAVTSPERNEISIYLKRFLKLAPHDRVFLLTHELLHLTKIDEKSMADVGAVGPFESRDGGRDLLNAMGASVAVMQAEHRKEIKSYGGLLKRSQGWKPFWVELGLGAATYTSQNSETFASDSLFRIGVTGRYSFSNWFVALNARNESNNFTALDSVDVRENVTLVGFGGGYRWFPFSDPETYFGQSHVLLQGLVDVGQARLSIKENISGGEQITNDEQQSLFGASAQVSYYFPFFFGTWWHADIGYEFHPYKYDDVNLKYDSGLTNFSLGVAYGF